MRAPAPYMGWPARAAIVCVLVSCGRAELARDTVIARDTADARNGAGLRDAGSAEVGGRVTTSPLTARVRLALDGDGLMLMDAATGSTRTIAFGGPEAEAIAAVSAALGTPRARSTNRDCGAGPLDFVEFETGLLVNVQSGRFVGWTVRSGSERTPRTMSGIGVGSTRAELERSYAVAIAKTTIGVEFSAGGLQGVLASDAVQARVTDLWAGTNCVAR